MKHTPTRRHFRRERGQALVELALTAPLMVLLLLGLAEFGSGLNSYLTVVAAARDGARLGAEGAAEDTAIKSMVQVEMARLSPAIPATCNVNAAGICVTHPTVGSVPAVRVVVCYDHPLIVGIPGIVSGSLLMCSKTTMRVVT